MSGARSALVSRAATVLANYPLLGVLLRAISDHWGSVPDPVRTAAHTYADAVVNGDKKP